MRQRVISKHSNRLDLYIGQRKLSASILNTPTVHSFDKNLIICLVLWNDFQALSDSLRTSYHKQNKNACYQSVIDRHSNHWHFAQGMRRIVEVFGVIHRYKTNYVYNHDTCIWHGLTFDTAPTNHVMNWLRLKIEMELSHRLNTKLPEYLKTELSFG
eukprot:281804_1